MTILGKIKAYRFELFYRLMMSGHEFLTVHGESCPWTLDDRNLDASSRILCAGAGNDISFEKSLIAHGCRIVLLDPSPTGIETVNREALTIDQLNFLPVGLAGKDGSIAFASPDNPKEGSFKKLESNEGSIQFECKRLPTLMRELNWDCIDLLKMDIEGCEYEVLSDLLAQRLDVRQICVEFHHGPNFGRSRMETVRMIVALRKAGYRLAHRHEWDHTFIRPLK